MKVTGCCLGARRGYKGAVSTETGKLNLEGIKGWLAAYEDERELSGNRFAARGYLELELIENVHALIEAAEKGLRAEDLEAALRELHQAGMAEVEVAGERWAGAMQQAGEVLEEVDKQVGVGAREPEADL
jgi:hypothetical protein